MSKFVLKEAHRDANERAGHGMMTGFVRTLFLEREPE